MNWEDWQEQVSCVFCGALISPPLDLNFAFGHEGVLCWDCCIERGGSYDFDRDRWTEPPDTSDLIEFVSEPY